MKISVCFETSCKDLHDLISLYCSNFYHNQYIMDASSRRKYFRDFVDNAITFIGEKYGYRNLYEKQFGQNYVFMLMNKEKKNFDIGTAYLSPKDKYDADFGRFLAFARMVDVINEGYNYGPCVTLLSEVMPEFFD